MKNVSFVFLLFAGMVFAGTPQAPVQDVNPVQAAKRQVARDVAKLLSSDSFQRELDLRIAEEGAVNLPALIRDLGLRGKRGTADRILDMDYQVRAFKGTESLVSDLFELRLVTDSSAKGFDWNDVLVAFEPAGNESEWTHVEAFDREGRVWELDPHTAPQQAVLVVDLNGRKDLAAGLELMNRALRAAGLQSASAVNGTAKAGTETSKLTKIRLNDDEEPWVSGKAEVYAFVSGVQPNQAKAEITLVDMPYLDYDGRDYYPNQILVFWENYRYAAANVQLYEHDDNTNYQDLVLAVISGVEAILGVFAPQYAVIATVAHAIAQAMPGHWYSNDDDYLDTFYTLEKNQTYTNYYGAGGNAKISLQPYLLQSN